MKDTIISIICPLYRGEKYVNRIVEMVEKNYDFADRNKGLNIELILVNDYNEKIQLPNNTNKNLMIKLIQNQKNEGIHYSRVRGLKESRGKYVLFLDQDDDIEPQYISKQLEGITNYDAVICNGVINGREIYSSEKMLISACHINNYMCGRNRIVSPGQVLIKKAAIPDEWIDTILKSNGADDYFLWLLMLLQNKNFNYNYEILYKHNVTGSNTSNDLLRMEASVKEVIDNLYNKKIITKEQYEQITKGPVFAYNDNAKLLRLYQRSSRIQTILDCWLTNKEMQLSCEKYLKKQGIKCVVVYGFGILGRHLINELQVGAIEIEAIIDKDLSKGKDGIRTINIGDSISANAVIIITPVLELHDVEQKLCEYYDNEIIYIDQLIENMQ